MVLDLQMDTWNQDEVYLSIRTAAMEREHLY